MGRNRVFQVALAVSVVFHLSMVTIFSIQIPFTRPVVVYYPFDIVDPYTFEPVFRPEHATLRAPELADLFRRPTEGGAPREPRNGEQSQFGGLGSTRFQGLPTVDLPQLDYANLDLIAIRETQLELARTVDAARVRQPAINLDRQMDRLADTLIRQPLLEGFDGESRLDGPAEIIVQAAARGFVAEIEWLDPPHDRRVLFAPPMETLSGQFAASFTAPLTFDIAVAPGGQVEVAGAPMQLARDESVPLENEVERWRFDPVNRDSMHAARFTLRRAESAP